MLIVNKPNAIHSALNVFLFPTLHDCPSLGDGVCVEVFLCCPVQLLPGDGQNPGC